MSAAGRGEGRTGASAGRPNGEGVTGAWAKLSSERRLAVLAAIGLFLTLFLPWYQETVIATSGGRALQAKSVALTGWGAFSFVEGVIVLIAAGVVLALYRRAEGRGLPIPGGDGPAVLAAGGLASLLIFWAMFDNQGTSGHGQYATASGIEWGIFIALAVSVLLAYAGSRIRAAHEPESERREGDGGIPFWGPAPSGPPAAPAAGGSASSEGTAPPSPPSGRSHERRPHPPRPVAANGSPASTSEADPAATTRISQREAEGPPTRVSGSRRTSRPLGPPVSPEEPPTMRFDTTRRPRSGDSDEQLTMPLDAPAAGDRPGGESGNPADR